MTRLYARAHGGDRLVDYTPDVRFERTSILSSVRFNGETVPMVYNGALNGELFIKYITDFLIPTLKAGDIVIMDNLSSHKVKGVIEAIESVGATVLYLPPYSPDFNPTEQLWSKIKAFLRKVKARTGELLIDAITDAFQTISLSDIKNWFFHEGYSIRFVK
jgi:transposase